MPSTLSPKNKETPAEIKSNKKNKDATCPQSIEIINLKFSFVDIN